jgi:hypothetical protein
MMRLPDFTDPSPSVEWLHKEQARLHTQADKMMATTRIMEVFGKHGELSSVGGSYKYGLMVYPDLDIELTADLITRKDFAMLVADLASHPNVRSVATADTVNFNLSKYRRPKGYWIGIDVPFEGDRWGIDCWFQQPGWVENQEDTYAEKLSAIDQPARDAILAIKYTLIFRGEYGKKYLSGDIYDAVLDRGVLSVQDFESVKSV